MFFNLKKDILHDNVYIADFIELSDPIGPPRRWKYIEHLHSSEASTMERYCKKNSVSTVQAMPEYFLTCKHTTSTPPKTNDKSVQST